MAGVALGRLQQAVLLPALRAVQTAHAAALAGEPLPDQLRIGQLARQVHLGGDVGGLVVIALHEARGELHLVHIEALVEDELAGALHAPLADHEHAGACDRLLAVEPHHIDVDAGGKHDLLPIVQAAHHLQAALDAAGTLEIQILGRGGHLVFQLADQLAALPGQETLHPPHVAGVVLRRDRAGTHPRAASHVVVEAGAALARADHLHQVDVVGPLFQQTAHALPLRAGGRADGRDLAQRVDGLAGGAAVGIGAEVARVGAVALARVLIAGTGRLW